MPDIVVDLNDRRPVWTQTPEFRARVQAAVPEGWTIAFMESASEGTGDGSRRAAPAVLEAVAEARVYMGFGISPDILAAGPRLAWVHSGSAGVGSSLTPELRARDLVLTNTAGVHGPPMAEAVVGMILHFFRGFDFAVAAQARKEWGTEAFYAADSPLREFAGSRVGILGLGGIGREVAWRCAALGAEVTGLGRTGPDSATVEIPGPQGQRFPVVRRTGQGGFHELLAESDVVVVTAPDTPRTRGMMDDAAFRAMRPGSVFINVARGKVADQEALVRALSSGHLRGAGLDVFAREPLPEASPLWEMENVLVTPHVSPVTRRFWDRQADLVCHNLACFAAGRVEEMRNVVDQDAGY